LNRSTDLSTQTMGSSIKTLMTAVIAVAGAAVMALVLAEQTTPKTLHTGVRPDAGKPAAQPAPPEPRHLALLACPAEESGGQGC
jgi:hypothetical protein